MPTPSYPPTMTADTAAWIRRHVWNDAVKAEARHGRHSAIISDKPHASTILLGPSGWVYDLSQPDPKPGSGLTRAMWVSYAPFPPERNRATGGSHDETAVAPPPDAPGPIAATATWQAVMAAADYRCQCAGGRCGSQHSDTGRRCDVIADRTPRGRLLAAPADLTLPETEAAGLPVAELRAWCPACHKKALARDRAARRELLRTTPEPDGLFDTDSLS